MTRLACPDHAQLSDYLSASTPEATRAEVEDHALTCPECRAALSAFDSPHEPLVYLLRRRPEDPLSHEPALGELLARACRIGQEQRSTTAQHGTVLPDGPGKPPHAQLPRRLGKYELL